MNTPIPLQYGYCTGISDQQAEECAIHAARSRAGKILTFHVHLKSGAHYSLLGIDKIFHKMPTSEVLPASKLQPWSCFSDSVETHTFDQFRFQRVYVLSLKIWGSYITTFDWLDNAYSDMPEEFKQGHLIALDNGQYGLFPNNYLLFHDKTWTGDIDTEKVPKLKRQVEYINPESR